jgi:hypothetical protein
MINGGVIKAQDLLAADRALWVSLEQYLSELPAE